MTGNNCLLDSNIIIDLLHKGTNISNILDKVDTTYVPIIVEGELLYGARNSANPDRHLSKLKLFLANCILLDLDSNTANIYANIKVELRKKGKPIPENDIWIAALAIQHSLPLYTNDKHFKEIENITLFK